MKGWLRVSFCTQPESTPSFAKHCIPSDRPTHSETQNLRSRNLWLRQPNFSTLPRFQRCNTRRHGSLTMKLTRGLEAAQGVKKWPLLKPSFHYVLSYLLSYFGGSNLRELWTLSTVANSNYGKVIEYWRVISRNFKGRGICYREL